MEGFEDKSEFEEWYKTIAAYLGNLGVGSDLIQQQPVDVRSSLQQWCESGFKLRPPKCLLGRASVDIMGFRVSYGCFVPSDDNSDVFSI